MTIVEAFLRPRPAWIMLVKTVKELSTFNCCEETQCTASLSHVRTGAQRLSVHRASNSSASSNRACCTHASAGCVRMNVQKVLNSLLPCLVLVQVLKGKCTQATYQTSRVTPEGLCGFLHVRALGLCGVVSSMELRFLPFIGSLPGRLILCIVSFLLTVLGRRAKKP